MLIFGWNFCTTKDYGSCMSPKLCLNCKNKSAYNLVRSMKFFTLFFIPILPYETRYYLVCPICNICCDVDQIKRDCKELSKLYHESITDDSKHKKYFEQNKKVINWITNNDVELERF